MIKLTSLLIGLSFSAFISAQELCTSKLSDQPIYAHYKVTTQGSTQKSSAVVFVRDEQQVFFHSPAQEMTQHFYQSSNGHIGFIRFFDHFERAIEYPPGDANIPAERWQELANLFPANQLKSLKHQATQQSSCGAEEHYQGKLNGQHIELTWLPKAQLIKSMKVSQGEYSKAWQLTQVHQDQTQISLFISTRNNYHSTDYADVGDNEADPFLAKMINMGYVEHGHSGAYDSHGHKLELNGHHH